MKNQSPGSSLTSFISSIKDLFLSFIYPDFCFQCAIPLPTEQLFCARCYTSIPHMATFYLNTEAGPIPVIAAAPYEGEIKSIILQKQYGNQHASKLLANFMYQRCAPPLAIKQWDLLIPVPLHWTRYLKRGFNQAEIISSHLSELMHIPSASLIYRTRITRYQSSLSSPHRTLNLSNAFKLRDKYLESAQRLVEGKNILVIDDLYTSGATTYNMIKALEPYKPASLGIFVAARVP